MIGIKKKSFWKNDIVPPSLCGSFWEEKQFLLIFIPFYWFDQKKILKKSKFFSGFAPFQTW